jgi:multicomponent Na+:H+ antiporter subunit C
MELFTAILIGTLYAAAVYCLLQRHLVKLIFGLILLSHGANLLIFVSARLSREAAPLIASHLRVPDAPMADPLPQALILTAIVISFAVLAFALILCHRTYQSARTDDIDELNTTEL